MVLLTNHDYWPTFFKTYIVKNATIAKENTVRTVPFSIISIIIDNIN